MQSDGLRNKILEARQTRWDFLQTCADATDTLIVISVNMPGENKSEADGLCIWAEDELKRLVRLRHLRTFRDAAGTAVFLKTAVSPEQIKKAAVAVEERHPFCRLLDIDVYTGSGEALDRKSGGLPPRKCFLCGEPAVDCIRRGTHGYAETLDAAGKLLEQFGKFAENL